MISSRRALAAASLILLTGITVSCESGGGDKMLGNGALAVLEPGVNLSAIPATIILDPNDPTAPRIRSPTSSSARRPSPRSYWTPR